eukprot:2810453-Lingulodinium_polyedra.AAC.1
MSVSGDVAGPAGDVYARAKQTAIVRPATETRAPRPEQTDLDANAYRARVSRASWKSVRLGA